MQQMNADKLKNFKGIGYGLSSGMFWGLSTALSSGLLLAAPFIWQDSRLVAPTLLLAFFNDGFSAIWVTLLLWKKKEVKATLRQLTSRSSWWMIVAALCGGPLGMRAYLYAIDQIGASYTASISAVYPVVAALLVVVLLKERLPWYRWLGLLLAVFAIYGVSQSSDQISLATQPLGFMAAGLCVVGWSLEVVISSIMMKTNLNATQALCIRQWVCTVAYFAFIVVEKDAFFSLGAVIAQPILWQIALVALIGTLSYLNFYRAIEAIGPVKATGLNISYSIWAIIFSLWLVGGELNIMLIVCSGAMIVSCLLVARS